jgi:hypothetical protein
MFFKLAGDVFDDLYYCAEGDFKRRVEWMCTWRKLQSFTAWPSESEKKLNLGGLAEKRNLPELLHTHRDRGTDLDDEKNSLYDRKLVDLMTIDLILTRAMTS